MFGSLGAPEIFLILVIALIVFGPSKLPGIGTSLGKTLGEFRRAMSDPGGEHGTREADKTAETTRPPQPPGAPPGPVQ